MAIQLLILVVGLALIVFGADWLVDGASGIARKAKQLGAKVIHIGSNPDSGLKDTADLFLRIPASSRAKAPDEVHSQQPMTSLFEQSLLLLGDITAFMIVRRKNLDLDGLWQYHANLE